MNSKLVGLSAAGATGTAVGVPFKTRMLEGGRMVVALGHRVVQNGLGMGALVLGLGLGKGS
jgi:hypothetical protein